MSEISNTHTDWPMVEKLQTFLTINDDDDRKFTKCCHEDVLYRREHYSHLATR